AGTGRASPGARSVGAAVERGIRAAQGKGEVRSHPTIKEQAGRSIWKGLVATSSSREGTMAKKARKTKSTTSRKRAAAGYRSQAAGDGRPGGRKWAPPQREAKMAALPETNEPRPYTSRYPIPNEEFHALKLAAPKAKLAKFTAERSRDTPRKDEE